MSTAIWAPRHSGKPFATTSIRRPSVAGTSRFSSRIRRHLWRPGHRLPGRCAPPRAPAAQPMCARTPTCAQADRWSPRLSRRRPHWHRLGASGGAKRSLRSSRTRNSSLGTTKSGPVGRTVSAQLAPAPLWDSSSARDAESNSAKSTSNTRLSTAVPALRCHPRLTFWDGSSSPAKGPASAPSTLEFGSPGGGGTQRRARPFARWAAC